MLRWNLDITTKLAYGLTAVMVIFFSSAFVSLANAGAVEQPKPFVNGASEIGEEVNPTIPPHVSADMDGIVDTMQKQKVNQDQYIDRWQERKHEYRLLEEYAAWLRDHNNPGSGNFGPQGGQYEPFTIPLPTFFDVFVSIF